MGGALFGLGCALAMVLKCRLSRSSSLLISNALAFDLEYGIEDTDLSKKQIGNRSLSFQHSMDIGQSSRTSAGSDCRLSGESDWGDRGLAA